MFVCYFPCVCCTCTVVPLVGLYRWTLNLEPWTLRACVCVCVCVCTAKLSMHDKRMQKIHLKQPKEQAKWDEKVQLCRAWNVIDTSVVNRRVRRFFNMFKTTLMNFVVGYHPTSCHWIQKNASPCSFPCRKWFPTVSLPFICMWMDQYLSEYHITDMLESWFPLTSLALTYTVVFISMLHQQPCTRTLNTALIVHIWNTHLLHGIHICARIIDALESVQRFTTKICTKRLEYELSVSFG